MWIVTLSLLVFLACEFIQVRHELLFPHFKRDIDSHTSSYRVCSDTKLTYMCQNWKGESKGELKDWAKRPFFISNLYFVSLGLSPLFFDFIIVIVLLEFRQVKNCALGPKWNGSKYWSRRRVTRFGPELSSRLYLALIFSCLYLLSVLGSKKLKSPQNDAVVFYSFKLNRSPLNGPKKK